MKKLLFLFLVLVVAVTVYNLWPEPMLSKNATIDLLVVHKGQHRMMAYDNGTLLKTYKVSFGGDPKGHKAFEGDQKTPEGEYSINARNDKSVCHKNLGVSYPNTNDIENAKLLGKPPGGDIKIHGLRNGIGFLGKLQRLVDWTDGCIAVTNKEADELYKSVTIGAKIQIQP